MVSKQPAGIFNNLVHTRTNSSKQSELRRHIHHTSERFKATEMAEMVMAIYNANLETVIHQ